MAGSLVWRRWCWLALPVAALLLAVLAPVRAASAAPGPGGPVELGYCGGDDWEPTVAASVGRRPQLGRRPFGTRAHQLQVALLMGSH